MQSKMLKYIGCKIIRTELMNEHKFLNKIKNEIVPGNQEDRPGYLVQYPDGYVSWSPKEVFEAAYREISQPEVKLLEDGTHSGRIEYLK